MKQLFAALVMVLAIFGPAAADDWADCSQGTDLDLNIRACSNIIAAGRESREHIARAYVNRGLAYDNKDDYDRAITSYTKAIELEPNDTKLDDYVYLLRGLVYRYTGDYDRAIADYTKAIELNPKYVDAYKERGFVYGIEGDYDRSIADETKDIELYPSVAFYAYVFRANAYAAEGDLVEAQTDFRTAAQLIPASTRLRDYDRVVADETKAIELNPKLAYAYVFRGNAYAAKGRLTGWAGYLTKAMADFSTAAQLTPAADPWHEKALALLAELAAASMTAVTPPKPVTKGGLDFSKFGEPVPEARPTTSTFPDLSKYTEPVPAPASTPITPPKPATKGGLDFSKFGEPAPKAEYSGQRIALVVGNGEYRNVAHLTNPINDANLIAGALKTDGFAVTVADNLDRDSFISALKTFASKADSADWAVVYFAGHGMEMGGINYLIPVDAKLLTDRDVELETVPLSQVINAMDGAHALRLVILDACRNNPFGPTMKRTAREGRDVGRGLARIEPTRGMEIVYSAKEGTIAADGDGANSPFAAALAQHLTEPGVEVDKLFRLVRDDVLDATGNKQEPFVYGSLPGRQDFYFRLVAR